MDHIDPSKKTILGALKQFLHKEVIMRTGSSWKTFVGAVMLAMLVGCASVASGPPSQMVEQNDHAGLAAWYKEEAKHLRAHAEDMRQMEKDYERRMTKPGQRSVLIQHCRNLVEKYTKAAEEADALAKLHEEQIGR